MLRMLGVVAVALFLTASRGASEDAPLTPAGSPAIADNVTETIPSQVPVAVRPTPQRDPQGPVGAAVSPARSGIGMLFARQACDSSSGTVYPLSSPTGIPRR